MLSYTQIAFARADETSSVAGNLIKVGAGLAARQAVIDMSEETPNYTIADDLDPDDEMRADADPMCDVPMLSAMAVGWHRLISQSPAGASERMGGGERSVKGGKGRRRRSSLRVEKLSKQVSTK
jgi:hypothetical protein